MPAPAELDDIKDDLTRRMESAMDTLKREFGGLRTGRANPALLDPVRVDAYGTAMPLNQVATV
ncbi:MAG TPA: ribosome recycling factor, partial [Acidiphilium sp.]